MSKICHEPRGKVERGDVHREHRVREIIERPAYALTKGRQRGIEVARGNNAENGAGVFIRFDTRSDSRCFHRQPLGGESHA